MESDAQGSVEAVFTDTPPQSVNRIDHVGMIVKYENFQKYIDFLSALLNIKFDEPNEYVAGNVVYSVSWPGGLELIAPIREEGKYWERLQRFGEGCTSLIFGVEDIDAAVARAREMGVEAEFEFTHPVRPPWMDRFKVFREIRINAFGPEFASTLTLGQIEPK